MEIARQSPSTFLAPLLLLLAYTLINTSPVEGCCHNETNFIELCCQTGLDLNSSSCCNSSDCKNQSTLCVPPLKQLHIGAFLRYADEDRFAHKKAMEMAMEMINNRTDILHEYQIVLHFGDTHWGSGAKAIKILFDWIHNPPTKMMLIGPATTAALEPVAESVSSWNLLEITYAAIAPKFGSNIEYRNVFRMVPSTNSYNKGKLAFMKHFNWKRVAIIHQYDAEIFSPSVRELQEMLEKENISAIAVEGFQYSTTFDVSYQVKKLKSLDARIIIGEFSDISAPKVFCEAYKLKMYGKNYAWIMFGSSNPSFIVTLIKTKKSKIDCTVEEIIEFMEGMVGMGFFGLRQDNVTTVSGLTSKEYWNKLSPLHESPTVESSFSFDCVWTTAIVMDSVLKKDKLPPENFTYSSRIHMKAFRKAMDNVLFEGVSGTIRFDKKRGRQGLVQIKQIRNASWVKVGQHLTYQNKLEFFGSSEQHLWPGNRVPIDQMIRLDELLLNPVTLIVVIWLLAFVGALLSVAFLYFNIVYRENRSIKMSSPQLNNVIILGCLLCYISVVLFGLDGRFLSLTTYGINCNARTAVLSVGFSLAFGAMFSKTWRVHKIFTAAKTLKKMAIKDIHLFGIVAVLVIVDVIYLSLWFTYDPLQANKLKFKLLETTYDDKIYVPVLYQCNCQNKTYFLAAMYAYKGILLLFGLFLAWETRNVTIPALNDSKYIGMSVYNVVTLSCIGAIVTTALDNTIHYEAPYAISSLCLIICTTATLLLVFVPKVYNFVMATDDQSFNTTTMNNGVATTIGRNQSHAFRFDSDNGTKATRYSTKSVQTDHREVIGSEVNETFKVDPDPMDHDMNNINKGYEIHMDDIELNDSTLIPKTRYDQQVTDTGLVTLMLTDM